MKTQEEIEQLAENSSEFQEATYKPQHKITYQHGYIDGYTQCQEDIAKEVEELKKTERHLAYQTSVYLDEMNKLKSHKNENIT